MRLSNLLALSVMLFGYMFMPVLAQEMTRQFGSVEPTRSLIIRSTTDISVFGSVVEAFLDTQPGLAITYEQWGSNDLFELSLSECREDVPGADLIISSGVHQMVKLVNEACALTHRSVQTSGMQSVLRWRDQLWGITREPAVMVYNRALVPSFEVPQSRFDLLDLLRPSLSRYAGRVATYDIERSGLGYLFAFSDSREATTFGALLESFGRTGVVATCCSAEIIEGVAEGTYLIAYNVLGSYARSLSRNDDRIGIVLPQDYTLVLSRALMVPKQARNSADATRFLDFLLSPLGQAELRRVLLWSPLLDDEGESVSETSLRPIGLSPSLLVSLDKQKREQFIKRWRSSFP
ncbi:ABC transporter substrate-binding protein [Roseibium algae]|uniref:ABC transporter substrate-binding protein n=1 Tax=Roseibium algae TaxID=3123038 RepID=A0ABU8TFG6_9HYPH